MKQKSKGNITLVSQNFSVQILKPFISYLTQLSNTFFLSCRCAVFNATGVRDKAQGIMEEPKPLSWWWPVYCSYQLNIEGFLREKKYVA